MAGERDRKSMKKTEKITLLAIIDGKESIGQRVTGMRREVGGIELECPPEPARRGIILQDRDRPGRGWVGAVVAVDNLVIDPHARDGAACGIHIIRARGDEGGED